jgi:hypothetical protein
VPDRAPTTGEEIVAFIGKHRWAVQASVANSGYPQAAVIGVVVTDDLVLVFDSRGRLTGGGRRRARPSDLSGTWSGAGYRVRTDDIQLGNGPPCSSR